MGKLIIEIGKQKIIDREICDQCGKRIKICVPLHFRHLHEKEGWCECDYIEEDFEELEEED